MDAERVDGPDPRTLVADGRGGMADDVRAHIAGWLNVFPEVTWDRLIETNPEDAAGEIHVYGWIARDDGRSDFLHLDFWNVPEGHPGFLTSSAALSDEFGRRIYTQEADGEHTSCQRVETVFGDLVANKIELPAEAA